MLFILCAIPLKFHTVSEKLSLPLDQFQPTKNKFSFLLLFVCSRIILRKETGHPMTYIARSDDLLSSPRGLRTLTEGSAVGSCFFYTISSSPGISSLAACSRVKGAAVTSLIQLHMAEHYITSTIKIHVYSTDTSCFSHTYLRNVCNTHSQPFLLLKLQTFN